MMDRQTRITVNTSHIDSNLSVGDLYVHSVRGLVVITGVSTMRGRSKHYPPLFRIHFYALQSQQRTCVSRTQANWDTCFKRVA